MEAGLKNNNIKERDNTLPTHREELMFNTRIRKTKKGQKRVIAMLYAINSDNELVNAIRLSIDLTGRSVILQTVYNYGYLLSGAQAIEILKELAFFLHSNHLALHLSDDNIERTIRHLYIKGREVEEVRKFIEQVFVACRSSANFVYIRRTIMFSHVCPNLDTILDNVTEHSDFYTAMLAEQGTLSDNLLPSKTLTSHLHSLRPFTFKMFTSSNIYGRGFLALTSLNKKVYKLNEFILTGSNNIDRMVEVLNGYKPKSEKEEVVMAYLLGDMEASRENTARSYLASRYLLLPEIKFSSVSVRFSSKGLIISVKIPGHKSWDIMELPVPQILDILKTVQYIHIQKL